MRGQEPEERALLRGHAQAAALRAALRRGRESEGREEMKSGPLTNAQTGGILELRKQAIICPNCKRKVRGVRLLPGAVMRNASVMCQSCGMIAIVQIDEASATYSLARAARSSNRGR